MSLWIITTGNSDVYLNHDKNWIKFFPQVRNDLECKQFSNPSRRNNDDSKAGYVVPARLLGHVYKQQSDYYESDLCFPLLDTFCKLVEAKKIRLDRVVMLLSDQQDIFKEQQRCSKLSPYWQDTCTLKPIFEWYFQHKLKLKPEFLLIQPQSGQGLDHWNETLSLINNVLQSIESNPLKNAYVSHQAGTPAISSAVQFVVLNKFKKVSFILSNQYYDSTDAQESQAEEVEYILQAKPEEVNSNTSEYRRSFQILKAKQLITDGFPGAALKILEEIERIQPEAKDELEQMVHFFNLHSVNRDSTKDFEIDNASQRIVDSLDLISHFLNQNNYLQGITLLAAAQETFLKVAIFQEIQKITDKYQGVSVAKLIQWDNEGLSLIQNQDLRR